MPYRIDPPKASMTEPVAHRRQSISRPAAIATGSADTSLPSVDSGPIEHNDHGSRTLQSDPGSPKPDTDALIRQLQARSEELDAREVRLNVRASLQDIRERQFRLHRQDTLADQTEQLRSIERRRNEIETQARRLAFLER